MISCLSKCQLQFVSLLLHNSSTGFGLLKVIIHQMDFRIMKNSDVAGNHIMSSVGYYFLKWAEIPVRAALRKVYKIKDSSCMFVFALWYLE